MSYQLRAAMAAAVLFSCGGGGARASDTEPPVYTFSGYGTVGVAHSSDDQADFAPTAVPNGPGYSRRWSTDVDSRLAGQLTANFNRQWSAVVQVVAEQQWDNTYRPVVEWANVQYAPTPDIRFRVGRIVLPTLLLSDSRKVGYTLPWVRPPGAMYGVMLPVSNSDGVDASYDFRVGRYKNTITAHAGKKHFTPAEGVLAGTKLSFTRVYGLVDTLVSGAATVQLAHLHKSVKLPLLGVDTLDYYMNALGASYDPGRWFLTGEWSKTRFALFGDTVNWYVGGGYRFGDFTPYLMVSDRRQTQQVPFSLVPPQRAVALGVRWDLMKNTDLKLQYERNGHMAGSTGTQINRQPGSAPGNAYHLVSATVDFVF